MQLSTGTVFIQSVLYSKQLIVHSMSIRAWTGHSIISSNTNSSTTSFVVLKLTVTKFLENYNRYPRELKHLWKAILKYKVRLWLYSTLKSRTLVFVSYKVKVEITIVTVFNTKIAYISGRYYKVKIKGGMNAKLMYFLLKTHIICEC